MSLGALTAAVSITATVSPHRSRRRLAGSPARAVFSQIPNRIRTSFRAPIASKGHGHESECKDHHNGEQPGEVGVRLVKRKQHRLIGLMGIDRSRDQGSHGSDRPDHGGYPDN